MGLFRKLTSRGSKPSSAQPSSSSAAPPPVSNPTSALSRALDRKGTVPELDAKQENALAALNKHDTVFLVDDSGSMSGASWEWLSSALSAVVRVAAQYDHDGIDLAFFNSSEQITSRSADEILAVFARVRPQYTTPTANAVKRVLEPYMQSFETWHASGKAQGQPRPKPLNLIILTDGAPDKGQSPEGVIVDVAKRLDALRAPPFQIGLSFVQIGNYTEAAEHLRSLDDDLREKHGIRDMVDTTLFEGSTDAGYLLKALLGGINRSIDKQG
ncbi:hypothetical protein JCM8547_001916 [Rhodosporidiobolus lusitaniae]